MEAYETEEYKGYTINIYHDDNNYHSDDLQNDNEMFLVHYHNQFWVEKPKIITKADCQAYAAGEKIEQAKEYHFFLTKAYIHSGVTISLAEEGRSYPDEQWDVSRIGYVLVSKKLHRIRKKAYRAAKTFIEAWDMYLTGEIFRYEVVNPEGDWIDSCCGYWGYDEGVKQAIKEAKSSIDYDIQKRQKERAECTLIEVGCIL